MDLIEAHTFHTTTPMAQFALTAGVIMWVRQCILLNIALGQLQLPTPMVVLAGLAVMVKVTIKLTLLDPAEHLVEPMRGQAEPADPVVLTD